MSNYYIARVSEAGLDFIRSDFKIPVKADSLSQARAGVNRVVFEIERATDQEIFDIARSGNLVLNLSDVATDEGQQALPLDGGQTHAVDMTQPSAHDGTVLVGATKSGSAPNWLQEATSSANTPATDTGD